MTCVTLSGRIGVCILYICELSRQDAKMEELLLNSLLLVAAVWQKGRTVWLLVPCGGDLIWKLGMSYCLCLSLQYCCASLWDFMERIFCRVILFCFLSKFPVSCFFVIVLFLKWNTNWKKRSYVLSDSNNLHSLRYANYRKATPSLLSRLLY